MKKVLYLILSLLLCVGAVGGTVALTKHLTENKQNEAPMDESTLGDDNESTDNISGNDEEETPNDSNVTDDVTDEETSNALVAPANEASLICEDLEMVTGAQLYMGEDADRPALRFTCNITEELKTEVESDSTKKIAMLLIPLKFFDRVNTENYTYIDWVNAFDEAGIDSYYLSEFDISQFVESGSGYYIRYRLEDIPYAAVNMEVACMGVLIDNSTGAPTYRYSTFAGGNTYRTNARSVAYVASATLNAYELGLEELDETQLALMQGYVNESVDVANGLTEATDDGSTYLISVNATTKTMSVGETFQVEAEYSPSDVRLPIWYRSNDTSVVTIDDNGLITAVGTGTAVIGVYVAGEVVAITVTVA